MGGNRVRRLRASQRARALITRARHSEWLNVEFQERFWSEVVHCAAAQRWPVPETHKRHVLRRYIGAVEDAGLEVCESFLRAVLTGSSTSARFGFAMHSTSAPPSGSPEQAFASYGVAERGTAPLLHCAVASSWHDVGLVPWEAAYVLAEYCVLHPELVAGQRVVELGAGLGLTGLLLARYAAAAEVTLTDYSPRVLANAEATIQRSGAFLSQPLRAEARGNRRPPPAAMQRLYRPGRIHVQALDWMDFSPAAVRGMGAGLWLAADVTYAPELCAPLASLLACALGAGGGKGNASAGPPPCSPEEAGDTGQSSGEPCASGAPFRHVVPFEYVSAGSPVDGDQAGEEQGGNGAQPARVEAPLPARPAALVACAQRNRETFEVFLAALCTEGLLATDISGAVHRELGLVAGAAPQCRLFHYPNGSAVRVFRIEAPGPAGPA